MGRAKRNPSLRDAWLRAERWVGPTASPIVQTAITRHSVMGFASLYPSYVWLGVALGWRHRQPVVIAHVRAPPPHPHPPPPRPGDRPARPSRPPAPRGPCAWRADI